MSNIIHKQPWRHRTGSIRDGTTFRKHTTHARCANATWRAHCHCYCTIWLAKKKRKCVPRPWDVWKMREEVEQIVFPCRLEYGRWLSIWQKRGRVNLKENILYIHTVNCWNVPSYKLHSLCKTKTAVLHNCRYKCQHFNM